MTPSQCILPSGLEIARILIAGVVGIVHQQTLLAANVAAADTANIRYVGPVRPDQEVEFVVIGADELPSRFFGAVDAILRQLALCRKDIPCYYFQYNTLLLANRELSPNKRRP